MTPKEILTIRNHMALIGRTRQHIAFLYVLSDGDGLPFLLTDPRKINSLQLLDATENASDPRYIKGRITRAPEGLLSFVVPQKTKETVAQRLIQDLVKGFAGQIPSLQNALVQVDSEE